jgi:hypothetical protein
MLDLDPIKARLAAASPGPWAWEQSQGTRQMAKCIYCAQDKHEKPAELWVNNETFTDADAEFCACARDDIPALVSEIERLTAERDAAVRDLTLLESPDGYNCLICKYKRHGKECDARIKEDSWHCWEWRGVQESPQ